MARSLGPGTRTVHQDECSMLMLDRAPIPWRAGSATGLAWSEAGPAAAPSVSSWQEAARELSSCGLVIDGGRRYLHSSVAGVLPIYHLEDGGATYFCSRIDPLVRSARRGRLTIDWEAWAAIFMLTCPLGDRTPFEEVRRLPPFSRLEHPPGKRSRARMGDWPWAAETSEPDTGREPAGAVVEELERALEAVEPGPLVCPLSGGWDSRLLLILASRRESTSEISALTLAASPWRAGQERYARSVASALRVPLAEIPPGQSYWSDLEETALRTDFQTTHHAWFMPLARRLARRPQTALDGLAGGILLKGHFVDREMLASGPWQARASLLWAQLCNARKGAAVLSGPLTEALAALAWRGWLREAEPFAGHPAQLTLTAYRTRTVRAISLAPASVLGEGARVRTPFTDDRVARAALAVPARAKLDGALYRRIFELVDARVGSIPSTNDPAPRRSRAARKHPPSRRILDGYRRHLEASPLGAEINPSLLGGSARGELEHALSSTRAAHLLRSVALLSIWQQRYADRLRRIELPDLLG